MSDMGFANQGPAPGTGSPIGSEVAPAGPISALHRPVRRRLVASIALGALVLATGAFLMIRPDLPPRTDFDSVSRLVASNQIMDMELRGDTLTLMMRSGARLRLESITTDEYRRLQPAGFHRLVVVSPSNSLWSVATELAMVGAAMIPAMLGASIVLVVQAILRRRQVRSATG